MRGAAFLPLVFLAGCGGGLAPLPIGRIDTFFPAGGVADVIEVETVDRLGLESAALVAPDGRTTPASSIVTQPAPGGGTVVALPGAANRAAGPGDAPPVGGGVGSEGRLLATVSQAMIAVPDPVAYRRDWPRYRLRLRFGTPLAVEQREIAAPRPPPVAPPPP